MRAAQANSDSGPAMPVSRAATMGMVLALDTDGDGLIAPHDLTSAAGMGVDSGRGGGDRIAGAAEQKGGEDKEATGEEEPEEEDEDEDEGGEESAGACRTKKALKMTITQSALPHSILRIPVAALSIRHAATSFFLFSSADHTQRAAPSQLAKNGAYALTSNDAVLSPLRRRVRRVRQLRSHVSAGRAGGHSRAERVAVLNPLCHPLRHPRIMRVLHCVIHRRPTAPSGPTS